MTTAQRLPGLGAWSLALGAGLGLVLLLAALLVSLRLEKALMDLLQQRSQLLARQVAQAAEGGLRFGVTLADQPELPRQLDTLARSDPRLQALAVLNEQGDALYRQGPAGAAPAVPAVLGTALTHRTDAQGLHTWLPIHDATGNAVGTVWVCYATTEARTALTDSLTRLGLWALGLTGAATALLTLGVAVGMGRIDTQLAALDSEPSTPLTPWPLLPLPQAWQRVLALERELDAVLAEGAAPTHLKKGGT